MIIIGSLSIPFPAGFDANVSYKKLAAKTILRSKNGTGIMASRWKKLGVTLSGTGWLPDGLDSIDEDALVDVHSTGYLSTASASNVITIPRVFRTDDFAPKGQAVVDNVMVETSAVMAGQIATLGVIAGATQYHVLYCPIISSFINTVDRSYDESSNTWSWTIEAEEQ